MTSSITSKKNSKIRKKGKKRLKTCNFTNQKQKHFYKLPREIKLKLLEENQVLFSKGLLVYTGTSLIGKVKPLCRLLRCKTSFGSMKSQRSIMVSIFCVTVRSNWVLILQKALSRLKRILLNSNKNTSPTLSGLMQIMTDIQLLVFFLPMLSPFFNTTLHKQIGKKKNEQLRNCYFEQTL